MAFVAVGLGLTGWLNPIAGLGLIAIGIIYWLCEILTLEKVSHEISAKYRVLIGGCVGGVILAILLVLPAYRKIAIKEPKSPDLRSLSASPPLAESPSNPPPKPAPFTRHIEHPTGFLQFDKPQVPEGYGVIAEGKQFGVNFRSFNGSSEKVLRAFGYTSGQILPATDQSDKLALERCSKEIESLKRKYASNKINGPEVGVGQNGPWGTVFSPTTGGFSKDEATQIISKKLRLYYVSLVIWTDLQGRVDWADDCRWLQIPAGSGKEVAVWHFCDALN